MSDPTVTADDLAKVKWNEWTVKETVELLVQAAATGFKRSIFLVGHRGVGKSSAVYQAAKKSGREVLEDRVSHKLPEDVRGVLCASRSEDKAVVLRHPDHEKLFDGKSKLFWFLDEFTHGAPSTQGAYYDPILDHRIGGRDFNAGTVVVLASNREDENANISMPDRPLQNRVMWVYVKYDYPTFFEYAAGEGRFHPFVLGALKDNWKWAFQPLSDDAQEYFGEPLPRSWEFVSDALKAMPGLPDHLLKKTVAGFVGPSMATDFVTWLRTAGQLSPVIDAICRGENKTAPTPGQQFYVTGMLADRFRADRSLGKRLLDYAKAIKKTHGEFGGLLITELRGIDWDAVKSQPNYRDVAKDYYAILV